MRFHPCPKCGKKDAAADPDEYCGPCRETLNREVEEFDMLTDANFNEWARQHNL